jgi:hypothetical protein
MVNNTQGQCDANPYGGSSCGCAFACHESHPSSESYYIPVGTGSPKCTGPTHITGGTGSPPSIALGGTSQTVTGQNYSSSFSSSCNVSGTGNAAITGYSSGGEDNFALARALGVTLRIDNLVTATQNLMTTARTTATSNSATYRVAIDTFDINFNTIQTLTSNLTTASGNAANIAQLEMYSNNHLVSGDNNQDADTNLTGAFSSINTLMPNPGGGTKVTGDTPQEVLLFVSDGVEDEMIGGTRTYTTVNNATCNAIKNRGIRIAVLYTVYYPLSTNGWYNSYIAPFQSSIASAMQSCASPGLYFAVDTGGDISAAMTALFNSAVQSAYISH